MSVVGCGASQVLLRHRWWLEDERIYPVSPSLPQNDDCQNDGNKHNEATRSSTYTSFGCY
jgi:hypothetical protein